MLVYFIFVIHLLNGSVRVNGNLQKHIVNSWQVFVQSAPAEKLLITLLVCSHVRENKRMCYSFRNHESGWGRGAAREMRDAISLLICKKWR